MSARFPTAGPPGASPLRIPPPDGVVVAMTVHTPRWARRLPPAPGGPPVTVSFSSARAAGEHAGALQALGYRVVRVAGAAESSAARNGPSETPTAWFLVPRAVAEAAPGWWHALVGRADRVLDLTFGPVAAALADVLELHASVTDPRPRGRGGRKG